MQACDFHLLDSDAFSRVCQPGDPEGLEFRAQGFMAQRGRGRPQMKDSGYLALMYAFVTPYKL